MQATKKPQAQLAKNKSEEFDLLQRLSTVVEAHDQVIFQSIIGINVLQKILIDKGIITIEELQKIAEEEANLFKQKVEEVIGNSQ